MKTIDLYQKFDFDEFMRTRGWSSLIAMFLYTLLFALVVFKTFNPQS